jgi:ribosomal protein S18 acetylase RimI-like enzyme
MNEAFTIPKSISKTAIDSLKAKLSAADSGWLQSDGHDDVVSSYDDQLDGYIKLLEKIHKCIDDNNNGQHQTNTNKRRRRQTPLVNAGYAARMAVMTFLVEEWIDSVVISSLRRQIPNNGQGDDDAPAGGSINIVVLGCGLDALGLWSKHALEKNHHQTTLRLQVYEIDAHDNCVLKQQALERSGILHECLAMKKRRDEDAVKNSLFGIITEGSINTMMESNSTKDDSNMVDYHLLAMDLRDIRKDTSLLKRALDSTGFDGSNPTLVLSELVLAYMEYESVNAILQSIVVQDRLSDNEFSMFACLEPMLPTISTEQHNDSLVDQKLLSVRDSYARDYAKQFLEKLNRGTCSSGTEEENSNMFHPLGVNEEMITARFISCGYSMANIGVASLNMATAKVACARRKKQPRFLCAKEPFDELAALKLNLGCYAVACAFASSSDNEMRGAFPWLKQPLNDSSATIKITPISDAGEDMLVGELYSRIYTHLYDEQPAIRKMVKSALKMDLRADSSDDGSSSAISNRFKAKGGEFWVAYDMKSSEMVGCVGIRQRKTREYHYGDDDRESSSSSILSVVEYEVQRLAVDDQHRGKGIGKSLLNAVYEYSLQHGMRTQNSEMLESTRISPKLWAVTPEILVAANKLYKSNGFRKEESFEGGLCMNVYCKTISL